jgi:predicted ABC-type ATPase
LPVLTVFAGPNGSGKSSIIRRVHFAGRDNLLEADAIAVRIHASDPRVAAIAAGREVLRRTQRYLQTRDEFAIETTLSGIWIVRVIGQAIARGFFVRLVYICLDSPERCIQRVRERVAQGGHSVPDNDVRRRYARSLSNARQVLKTVNEALIYDNSGPEPRLALEMRSGGPASRIGELPNWARSFVEEL